MPPKPTAPASRVSHTCGFAERAQLAAAGRLGVARAAPARTATTSATVSSARPATAQYAERQPSCWPSQVAAGTPTTLATESPSITRATARPLRAGRAMLGRDQGGDAEVGAVRQPGGEPGQHEQRRRTVASALSGVADGVGRHQRDQQAAPRQTGAEEGQHRRADDHPEGVRRDHVAGRSGSRRRRRWRSAAADPSSRTRWCRWRSRPWRARAPPGRSGGRSPRDVEVGDGVGGGRSGGRRHHLRKARRSRSVPAPSATVPWRIIRHGRGAGSRRSAGRARLLLRRACAQPSEARPR